MNAIIFVPVVRQALGLRQGAAVVHFRLGAAEFRLFGAILLLLLVTFVLAVGLRLLEFGLGLVTSGRGVAIGIVAALIVLATSLAFVYAIVRLGFLILPVTVAEEQISLVRGWIVTKGNFWRIFAVVLAIGIPIALLGARLIATQLYGVHAYDPLSLLIAAVVLSAAAAVAGFVPARRASAIEPMKALRSE